MTEHFAAPIAKQIWDGKYRFKEVDGTPIDVTVEDTWRRIARALAAAEKPEDQAHWEEEFYKALEGFKFLPAGRIVSGAGTGRRVTMQNCLSADTMLLTKEYGLTAIGLLAGEIVHVLDGDGNWVIAPVNSFDEQEVVEVELALISQSRVKTTVRATKNHRWILSDGSERTTATLKHGDLLKPVSRRKVLDNLQYREGLRHGIVFGDGNQREPGQGSLRLCGEKSCFAHLFEMVESGWRRVCDIDGDPNFYLPTDSSRSYKTLPGTDSIDYLTGFMRGWLATDGSVCKRDGKALISCGADELEWLKAYGPIVGFEVAYASKLPNETNFGKRNKDIFNATLRRHLLTEDDILRPSHREKFQALCRVWFVKGVADSGNVEPVFCPSVSTTASMELGNGVHTGNCYVLGTIPDSMTGIFDELKGAALTMQQGGGIGHDFSTIRPKGALVKGVGSDASGPLSFMECWDSMCRTVMSAGSRRGAMMATMRCDHPDIEAFIEAKRDPLKLRMFNMSVLVTDAFMQAVKDDTDWRLHFENRAGETLLERTVRARDLWDKIMKATYDYAEPGVIFIDRINAMNPLNYCETIAATNPCVPAGTPILTRRGWFPIEDTIGSDVEIWNGQEWSHVVPKITGHDQRLVTVRLSDGRELTCTPAHRFVNEKGTKIRAQDLEVGMKMISADWPLVHGTVSYARAYDQGFFSGDGTVKSNGSAAYIMLYGQKKQLENEFSAPLSRREYEISGGYEGTNTDETRLYLRYSTEDFLPKNFVPTGEWDVESRLRWLEGICDSDGCAYRSDNSVLVQISAKDRNFLYDIMLMLNTLGVSANLSAMKDCWRLGISANNVARLQQLGFQPKRLDLSENNPQREAARFPRVAEIIEHGEIADAVYCFTENKRHMGCFNGILTGQCGEQPLPPYGACLLGSINLATLIKDAFSKKARTDDKALVMLVHTAVRMLDNVIEVTNYPLPQQAEESKNKRRIGLGVTGVADALLMLGITYGSDRAVGWVDNITALIAREAYLASAKLAREKGAFLLFNKDAYLNHPYVQQFDAEVHHAIGTYGLRNSHLTSIAPTGTISLYAGNVSSGIEPVFAYHYTRKVLEKDGSKREEKVEDYAYAKYRKLFMDSFDNEPEDWSDDLLPDYFVSAQTLPPEAHVKMQAAAQKWVDSSISKTVNLPEDISFDDFKAVYLMADELGCKGCTTYRPNDVTGSVLSVDEPKKEEKDQPYPEGLGDPVAESLDRQFSAILASRPEHLMGVTYKLKWPGSEHAIYVTINDDETGKPFEIFINSKDPAHFQWTVGLTRMISAVFRRGGDIGFVHEELKAVFDPQGGAWISGKYVPSVLAAIGGIIERHMNDKRLQIYVGGTIRKEWLTDEELKASMAEATQRVPIASPDLPFTMIIPKGKPCPKCSSFNTKNEAGCFQCLDCDHSKCG